MEIITRTANGKTAFTAKVNYQGSDYMVVGQVPPAPKSSYVWFASDFVASPDVPEEVSKAIYTKLKGGNTPNHYKTSNVESTDDFIRYFDGLSYGELACVYTTGTPIGIIHFTMKYPGALTIAVIIDIRQAGSIRFLVRSKAQGISKTIRPTTRPNNGLFTLERRDKLELLGLNGDSMQEVLTRIAPYIAQKQVEFRARYNK